MSDLDALRDELGLEESAVLEVVAELPLPAGNVGHGLAGSELDERRLEELLNSPWIDDPTNMPAIAPARLQRSDLDRSVLLLRHITRSGSAEGGVREVESGVWVVDTTVPGTLLVFDAGEDRLALHVAGREGAQVVRLPANTASPLAGILAAAIETEEPDVVVPSPAHFLGDVSIHEHVASCAAELHASPSLADRIASVGLLARLASGAAADPGRLSKLVREGQKGPSQLARSWLQALSAKAIVWVAKTILTRVEPLADDLLLLRGAVTSSQERAAAAGKAICLSRDELESLAMPLRLASRKSLTEADNAAVEAALQSVEGLDELAVSHLSDLDLAGSYDDDPLLDEVMWQEPLAWWGARER